MIILWPFRQYIILIILLGLIHTAALNAQTRLASPNDSNASAGSGQSEIIINAENMSRDTAVWINGIMVAHLTPRTREKIIVQNGSNLVEAAETTVNRQGQWNIGSRRRLTVNSNTNSVTVGMTVRYGDLVSLNIQSTAALSIVSQPPVASLPTPTTSPTPSPPPAAASTRDNFRTDIEYAIYRAAEVIIEALPVNATVAVLSFATPDPGLADIIVRFMETYLVGSAKGFTVVIRRDRDLDDIRGEQNLHLSGDVEDNTAVSIGQWRGASIVITGDVIESGNIRLLQVRALDMQSTEVVAVATVHY